MSTRVLHRITGYDRGTELLVLEYDIPRAALPRIKTIARVGADDPEAIGSYPLDREQAKQISKLIGSAMDPDKLDFFLEPFAED